MNNIKLYTPPADNPPDREFPETLAGGHALILSTVAAGHALVVEYGDCSFGMHCECATLTAAYDLRPNQLWDDAVARWMHHVPGGARTVVPHCQCGQRLGKPLEAVSPAALRRVARLWEEHAMASVAHA